MTLPKKGLRKITVEKEKYAWSVTGTDDGLSLSVVPLKEQSNVLTARFHYHYIPEPIVIADNGTKITPLKQSLQITGYVVRQVIVYAVNAGWKPMEKGHTLNLGAMDDKIQLREEKPIV